MPRNSAHPRSINLQTILACEVLNGQSKDRESM